MCCELWLHLFMYMNIAWFGYFLCELFHCRHAGIKGLILQCLQAIRFSIIFIIICKHHHHHYHAENRILTFCTFCFKQYLIKKRNGLLILACEWYSNRNWLMHFKFVLYWNCVKCGSTFRILCLCTCCQNWKTRRHKTIIVPVLFWLHFGFHINGREEGGSSWQLEEIG